MVRGVGTPPKRWGPLHEDSAIRARRTSRASNGSCSVREQSRLLPLVALQHWHGVCDKPCCVSSAYLCSQSIHV
eukprot:scaffold4845_cov374-Prasinococcus_capsulatus_cf.AAC.3